MSLWGYKKKSRPAPWLQAFPEQRQNQAEELKRGERAAYRREARAFVRAEKKARKICPVMAMFDQLPSDVQAFLTFKYNGQLRRRSSQLNEVHHTHGRVGRLLNYKPWWVAISKWGHRAVHAFPKLFRSLGLLCPEGQWNKPPPNL